MKTQDTSSEILQEQMEKEISGSGDGVVMVLGGSTAGCVKIPYTKWQTDGIIDQREDQVGVLMI